MTSSKVLLVFLAIAAGYIFVSNFTITKGSIARSNGQHLYLKSAIYGIAFLFLGAFLHDLCPSTESHFFFFQIPHALAESLDPMTMAAITAIEISLSLLILLETPIKISNHIGSDLLIDRLLENRFRYVWANRIMMFLEGAWLLSQLASSAYTKWVERASLGKNQVDIMVWETLLSDYDILMVCDDNRKVFIGLPLQTPDPKQGVDEKTIKLVPIMSGSLCSDFQNLHITTDYTANFDIKITNTAENTENNTEETDESDTPFNNPSPAVLIFTKNIKYIRKFDIDVFDSFFIKKTCACGREIYLPKPESQKVSIRTSSSN